MDLIKNEDSKKNLNINQIDDNSLIAEQSK
jgi:hypothetical protein